MSVAIALRCCRPVLDELGIPFLIGMGEGQPNFLLRKPRTTPAKPNKAKILADNAPPPPPPVVETVLEVEPPDEVPALATLGFVADKAKKILLLHLTRIRFVAPNVAGNVTVALPVLATPLAKVVNDVPLSVVSAISTALQLIGA